MNTSPPTPIPVRFKMSVLPVCIGLCILAPYVAAQNATSNKQPGEVVTLPTFNVSSERANEYRAADTISASRIQGALIDVPSTINVITRDFIEDIGANTLQDATQYLAGIGTGRLGGTNGISDRQTLRGFESNNRTIDNLAGVFMAKLDPELYERVEVVKGPNAILSPTGAPGGSLNVITKSP